MFLKNLKPRRLKHNFIIVTTRPGADWFDDTAWSNICEHFRIIAKIAKETNCGLAFDPEAYKNSGDMFTYKNDGHSYEKVWTKARERGRQVMRAVASGHDGLTILGFFWYSMLYNAPENAYKWGASEHAGLFPAFINGMYDVMPPKIKIIDGNEDYGYRSADLAWIKGATGDYYKNMQRLIVKENRTKALLQTQIGVALYLDAYFPPGKNSHWTLFPTAILKERLIFLRRNLYYAMQYADEYVWTWGERGRWFPKAVNHWGKRVPGINNAMRSAKNINEAKSILEKQASSNLLEGCKWKCWAKDMRKVGKCVSVSGRGRNGSQALEITDFTEGGLICIKVPVKANELYLFQSYIRNEGSAAIHGSTYWCDQSGAYIWNRLSAPVLNFTSKPVPGGQWEKLDALILIPENAHFLKLAIITSPQQQGVDKIYLDDFKLQEINIGCVQK